MIDTLLDACHFVLENQSEPQSSYWLASQIMEMKLWRTCEADVRDVLSKDIAKYGQSSRFVSLADDKFALRSWPEQTKQPTQPTLAAVEADLFGAIFEFHKKVMTLLRQTSLDEKTLKAVADRIKTLLDSVTAEVKGTQHLNLTERLEAAYNEVRRLVDEISGFPACG
jgi:hypothetical protein